MKKIHPLPSALVLLLFSMNSLAATPNFELDFDQTRAGLNGEPDGIDYLRGCSDESALCALAAGTGLQHAGRNREAIEFFRRALSAGEQVAATALGFLHLDADEYLQAYSWARLAMEIDRRNRDLNRTELLRSQNAYLAAAALQAMAGSQLDPAEARAMRRLKEWEHVLPTSALDETESERVYRIVKQAAPRYPRRLAIDRIEGTVYLHARVNERGKVTQTIPVYFTHRPFAREAERALRKWKIEFGASEAGADDSLDRTINQRIDFNLSRE